MFYLTMHSTHFIYGYMASDIWLRTILIVRKETCCRHIGYSLRLTTRDILYAPSHRQDSTYHDLCYTSCEALAGTRNSSMGSPHEGSIRRPIAPWANALNHGATPRSHMTIWRPQLRLVVMLTMVSLSATGGAGRSSEVERSLMVRWVVGSILHGVDPLSYFSFQPELHDWCNKGRGMCYPVCGMVHIKEPLLLIDKSSLCGGSGFLFSLSEWSLNICLTPYNRR